MQIQQDTNNDTRRKTIGRLILIFFGVMLLLTFFSNTINNFSLPRVKEEKPVNGALLKEVSGEGTVEARETVTFYSESARKVIDVRVKAGDMVKKGQELVILDKESLEEKLRQEQLELKKRKLALEKLSGTNLQNSVKNAERDLENARDMVTESEKKLEITKALFDAGAESRENMRKAEKELEDQKRNYRQKQEDYEAAKADYGRELRNAGYDVDLKQLEVEKILKEINTGTIITSTVDGIVTEVNYEKGEMVNAGTPVVSVADGVKGFEFKVTVDEDSAEYLDVGDEVEISLKSSNGKILIGAVSEISDNQERKGEVKDITVDIPQEGLSGGERGEISASKKTRTYELLVANSCVGQDDKGNFVYIIQEKKGPLGNEYYVKKTYVTVDDSDNFKTAIINGLVRGERVVTKSDKTLTDGSRVNVLK